MILLNTFYLYLKSCLMQHKFAHGYKSFVFLGQNLLHIQPYSGLALCELYMLIAMLTEIMSSLQIVAGCFYQTMLDVSLLGPNYVVTYFQF